MKKIFFIGCGLFLGLLIIIVCIFLWLMSAVFDKAPSAVHVEYDANPIVLLSIIEKLKLSAEGVDLSELLLSGLEKGQTLSKPADIRKMQDKVLEFVLSQEEVNALIKYGIAYYLGSEGEAHKQAILRNLLIEFNDGIFKVIYSMDSGISTPFGRYVNFECKFIPEISNNNLHIKVKSLKAGKIFLPTEKLNKVIAEQIKKEKANDANLQNLLKIIKEAKVEGRNLSIKYSPYELIKLFMNKYTQEGSDRR